MQGALALNGSDKKYTVTVEGDKIIIEAKYYGTLLREATFRFIAHLKNDNTYAETCFDNDGYRMQYGSFRKNKQRLFQAFVWNTNAANQPYF